MSGSSYSETCPRCGGKMMCYSDWKPHDYVCGVCYDCGFTYDTKSRVNTLEAINELRQQDGLEPLAELKKPTDEWLSSGYENLIRATIPIRSGVKMKTLFGIKGYDRDYLLKLLDHTKAGRCNPEWYNGKPYLYFTLVVRGLRGVVDGRDKQIEALDNELKQAGFGNVKIIGQEEYVDLLLERFGQGEE